VLLPLQALASARLQQAQGLVASTLQ